jgi:ubiquinone biosynthesis protein COQ9
MSLATTEGRNASVFASKGQPKAARPALFRRLRAVRDIAYVLSAWAASWAFVLLVVKGLSGLF